jgi:hypothetical protein
VDNKGRALSLTALTLFAFDTILQNLDHGRACESVGRTRVTVRVRSVARRSARRGARLGTEEEAVLVLGVLEQVDEGTWESQDDVECESAEQNEIDMKYEDGGID